MSNQNECIECGDHLEVEDINQCPECGDHCEFEDTDYFCLECELHFDKCEECDKLYKEALNGKSCWNCGLCFCYGCNPELQNDELCAICREQENEQ